METDNSKQRKILLCDDVDNSSIKDVINKIFEIEKEDNFNEEKVKGFERKPIELYVITYGGSVYKGMALIDIMRTCKTPVHTYGLGPVMSMGLWIFMAGKKRYIGENTTLMYHEVSSFLWDKLTGIKNEVKEMERLQILYDKIVTSNSKVMQERLNEIKERKMEWYITPEDALKLELCHEVL